MDDLVMDTIKKYNMIKKGDAIVIGVSGGPDSVALLHFLVNLKDSYELELIVAHVNHMFRGKESNDDERYVRNLCERQNLQFFCKRVDVPSIIDESGDSPEEAARKARHDFYRQIGKEIACNKLALGHNADDRAETVLMRLFRGAGPSGLTGIKPVSKWYSMVIVRPLIEVYRNDIENYLKKHDLNARIDKTNLEPVYYRNKIRLELLPLLEREYSVNIKDRLNTMADMALEENEYMEIEAEKAYSSIPKSWEGHTFTLDTKSIKTLQLALKRRILRLALKEYLGNLKEIEFLHIDNILTLLNDVKGSAEMGLPGNVKLVREYDKLLITKMKKETGQRSFKYQLKVPGSTYIPECSIKLNSRIVNISSKEQRQAIISSLDGINMAGFDYSRINLPVYVRSRYPGDRIWVIGMKGKKKVKDILIDEKAPARVRDRVPLLVSEEKGKTIIYWVIHYRTAEIAKINNNTGKALIIEVIKTG